MTTDFNSRILRSAYKWLPIIFGCHCRADRSFFYKGRQFPICARCTGIFVGIILGSVTAFFWMPDLYICLLAALPGVFDSCIQRFTSYESNNRRRFLSGILLGYAISGLIIKFLVSGYMRGYRWGIEHFQ